MKSHLIAIVLAILLSGSANGERIKDIVEVHGVRGNPLTGIGLVVGLADTGDTSLPSRQMLNNILRRSGQVLTPDQIEGGNIAMVMVTAELGPFDREGSRIDVNVSSIGDADSLQGGVLLPTPLEGLDGRVYAVAQGGLSLGGWRAAGEEAAITKNHQTVGRVPGGATVEQSALANFINYAQGRRYIKLNLINNDFTTAQRISEAINHDNNDAATVLDAGTVRVQIPDNIADRDVIKFMTEIMDRRVVVDMPAVVVINERTGTIVVGQNVGISQVAISQGSLVVTVQETARVYQPTAPFSDAGTTEVVPETLIEVEEQEQTLIPMPEIVTVSELATALNAIGATPRDLIAIFNALKEAGALQAQLKIM